MKPHHLKSYLLTTVAIYAALVGALIAHGGEPLPVNPPAQILPPSAGSTVATGSGWILPAAPAIVPTLTGSGTLVCTGSTCPVPSLVKSDTAAPVNPAIKAFDDWLNARAAADKTSADLVAAKAALAVATTADTAAQASLEQARADLAGLIGPSPVVPPTPPPGPTLPVVSLLAVTATGSWCPACLDLRPNIDEWKAAGVPVKTIDPADPEAKQWVVGAIPTIILLVDGKEPGDSTSRANTRIVGFDPQVSSKGQPVLVNGHKQPSVDVIAWWKANCSIFVHSPTTTDK